MKAQRERGKNRDRNWRSCEEMKNMRASTLLFLLVYMSEWEGLLPPPWPIISFPRRINYCCCRVYFHGLFFQYMSVWAPKKLRHALISLCIFLLSLRNNLGYWWCVERTQRLILEILFSISSSLLFNLTLKKLLLQLKYIYHFYGCI